MKQQPVITVQLVHIQGPLKGEIQEFSEARIAIGRHQSCHLKFPADLTIISRNHAEIVRDGNRFKLVDHSTNGTFVNGKRVVEEAYLKNGDVLSFAEGGPKVSFLTQIQENQAGKESVLPAPQQSGPLPSPPHHPPESEPDSSSRLEPEHPFLQPEPPPLHPEPVEAAGKVVVHNVRVPLIIQYGPTLRSYKAVPVTMGKEASCDFQLDHPGIQGQHVQVFYSQDRYWVKDLTGQRLIMVNRQPIDLQSPLNPGDELSLGPLGPLFRFLGSGRLAEIPKPSSNERPGSPSSDQKGEGHQHKDAPENKDTKGPLSILKKLWKH
ncbi:MAG: FHA domain-containing protein [bacterium]